MTMGIFAPQSLNRFPHMGKRSKQGRDGARTSHDGGIPTRSDYVVWQMLNASDERFSVRAGQSHDSYIFQSTISTTQLGEHAEEECDCSVVDC